MNAALALLGTSEAARRLRRPATAISIALLGAVLPAAADVIHTNEIINSPVVWSAADNDHIVVGQVTISQSGSLTIEEGCNVLFDANAKLDVSGTLNSAGGASGILFTNRDPGETWAGIYFRHPSDGTLSDCTVEQVAATGFEADAIRVDQTAVVTIQDCTIRDSDRGIRVYQGSGPTISGCTIENNDVGIRYDQVVSPTLDSTNTWLNNTTGVHFVSCSGNPTVDNQTIVGSGGPNGAIFVQLSGEFTLGPGNAITGNSWGLTIDCGSGPSLTSAGNIPLAGNTNDDGIQVVSGASNQAVTWRNLADYIVTAATLINHSGVLTVDPGCAVRFDANGKLEVSGTLNAIGGVSGILFTNRDPGETWAGIYFRHPSDGILSDCTIEQVAATGFEADAIRVDQTAVVTIQDCTIRNSDRGIRVYQGSGPTISGCTIENNDVGIRYDQVVSPTLTAANTWLNNTTGVHFVSCSGNPTVDNQTITGSPGIYGAIFVQNSGEFTLGPGNSITGNSWGLTIDFGSGPSAASAGNIPLVGNTNPAGIQVYGGGANAPVTWRDLGADFIVTATGLINVSGHLTIEDGVAVLFGFNIYLSVSGWITAAGDTQGIQFRPWDSTGNLPWSGIQFWVGDGAFTNCLFWGVRGFSGNVPALKIDGSSSVALEDVWITQNDGGILVNNGSTVSLERCQVTMNDDYGIRLQGTNATATFGSDLSEWNDVYGNGPLGLDNLSNSTEDIVARYVYWGWEDETIIEATIYHEPDSPSLGLVTYEPWTDASHSIAYGTPFTDVTPAALLEPAAATGGAWGDYDGDGDHDLFVTGQGPNKLFRNDGGSFVDVTPAVVAADSVQSMEASWADFENDGDLDLFVANLDGLAKWYRNDDGTWTDHYYGFAAWSTWGSSWADVEGDGDLDHLIVEGVGSALLMRNEGDAFWSYDADFGPDTPRSARFGDFDDDGDPDLAIAGSHVGFAEVQFLRNEFLTFNVHDFFPGAPSRQYTTVSSADSDGDGDQDFFVGGFEIPNLLVCFEDSVASELCTPPVFADSGRAASGAWGDFDSDGNVDLFLTNEESENQLLQNLGGNVFVDVAAGVVANQGISDDAGASWCDYDGDGDLDVFVASLGGPNRLLRNDSTTSNHWFQVDLVGIVANRFGVGAKITVFTGGQQLVHEAGTGSGASAQNAITAHFGLGPATVVDSVTVRWTRNRTNTYGPFAADQRVTLTERVWLHRDEETLAALQGGVCSWGDYDDDGDEDLFVAGDSLSFFMRNDEGALSLDSSGPSLINTASSAWGDYDDDGLLDLLVVNKLGYNLLYVNEGGGSFSDVTNSLWTAEPCHWGSWVDYDSDGDLDVHLSSDSSPSRLFRNDGQDDLVDVTASAGALFDFYDEVYAAWGDYDDDGDLDLFSCRSSGNNALLRNDGGTFVDATSEMGYPGSWGMGAEWADYDADGDLDLLTYTYQTPGARLLRNDGASGWGEATLDTLSGQATVSATWQDYDNDGDLDLYAVPYFSYALLLRNDDGSFVDSSTELSFRPLLSDWSAWADVDENGGIDFVTTGNLQSPWLYRNTVLDGNSWLRLHLVGTVSNRSAIGARVTAVTGSERQMRELTVKGDGRSQSSLVLHFGLGQAPTVDSLIVRWPAGGVQVLTDVAVDAELTIVEDGGGTGVGLADAPLVFSVGQSYPNPFRSSTRIAFGLPEASHVNLKIFDVSGRLVRTLSNEPRPAGRHTVRWDGRDSGGRNVATGIYFYRFEAGEFRESKRLVRVR